VQRGGDPRLADHERAPARLLRRAEVRRRCQDSQV
jgi:hypothetical protein